MEIVSTALKIVNYPHPSLRHKAVPVKFVDAKILHLAEAMIELMYEHKGLGLAAPQVGRPIAMFVCNLAGDREDKTGEHVFLNPVIVERRGSMEGEEGCLSFPGMYRKVRRARSVKAQAYNLKGELIEMEASDTAPWFVSSLTSVSILRLMRPSDRTIGVKARPMPNSL